MANAKLVTVVFIFSSKFKCDDNQENIDSLTCEPFDVERPMRGLGQAQGSDKVGRMNVQREAQRHPSGFTPAEQPIVAHKKAPLRISKMINAIYLLFYVDGVNEVALFWHDTYVRQLW